MHSFHIRRFGEGFFFFYCCDRGRTKSTPNLKKLSLEFDNTWNCYCLIHQAITSYFIFHFSCPYYVSEALKFTKQPFNPSIYTFSILFPFFCPYYVSEALKFTKQPFNPSSCNFMFYFPSFFWAYVSETLKFTTRPFFEFQTMIRRW